METWKDVIGFESYYEVSNLCNIRRKKGTTHLKQVNLKFRKDKDGYLKVNLKVNQKSKTNFVHRIIAKAFIVNKNNKPQVNHINGIKDDNRIENLEWVTLSENRIHSYTTGLQNGYSRRGIMSNFSKLNESQVLEIRKLYKPYKITAKFLAEKFGVTESCVLSIISRKNWSWL